MAFLNDKKTATRCGEENPSLLRETRLGTCETRQRSLPLSLSLGLCGGSPARRWSRRRRRRAWRSARAARPARALSLSLGTKFLSRKKHSLQRKARFERVEPRRRLAQRLQR